MSMINSTVNWRAISQEISEIRRETKAVSTKNKHRNTINRERRAKRKALEQDGVDTSRMVSLKPLPLMFSVPEWVKRKIKCDADAKAVLSRRTPENWLSIIESKLIEPVRTRAACIVWWDYFSNRVVSEAWPHLNKFIDGHKIGVPDDIIADALVQIGYTRWQAFLRIIKQQDDNN